MEVRKMGVSYRDAFLLKRFLKDDSGWTKIDGMKRPRFFEFWKKEKWKEKLLRYKEMMKEALKDSYFEVDE